MRTQEHIASAYRVLSKINHAISFANKVNLTAHGSEKAQAAIYAYRQCHSWIRGEFKISRHANAEDMHRRIIEMGFKKMDTKAP